MIQAMPPACRAPRPARGVLREPNGIAPLVTQGFGAQIEDRAAEVACWLGEHPTKPGEKQKALEYPTGWQQHRR